MGALGRMTLLVRTVAWIGLQASFTSRPCLSVCPARTAGDRLPLGLCLHGTGRAVPQPGHGGGLLPGRGIPGLAAKRGARGDHLSHVGGGAGNSCQPRS
jgi:hypothetical protein